MEEVAQGVVPGPDTCVDRERVAEVVEAVVDEIASSGAELEDELGIARMVAATVADAAVVACQTWVDHMRRHP